MSYFSVRNLIAATADGADGAGDAVAYLRIETEMNWYPSAFGWSDCTAACPYYHSSASKRPHPVTYCHWSPEYTHTILYWIFHSFHNFSQGLLLRSVGSLGSTRFGGPYHRALSPFPSHTLSSVYISRHATLQTQLISVNHGNVFEHEFQVKRLYIYIYI